jgi:drug/metabolite transporter (DMT)-like permease
MMNTSHNNDNLLTGIEDNIYQQSHDKVIRGHQYMIIVTLIIASSFPVIHSIAGIMDSVLLTCFRFIISIFVLLPYVTIRYKKEFLLSWRSLPRYAILSAPLVLFFISMFEALRTTTPVKTSAIFTLGPGISSWLGYAITGERLTKKHTLALLGGMVGTLWVVFSMDLSQILEFKLVVGDYIIFAGTICFALYTVLVKRLFQHETMAVMTLWTLVTGTGWLLFIGWRDFTSIHWSDLEPKVVYSVIYLALFSTMITFVLTQKAVTIIGPVQTMSYTYLNPVLVLIISSLIDRTQIHWKFLPGMTLTILSMIALQQTQTRR